MNRDFRAMSDICDCVADSIVIALGEIADGDDSSSNNSASNKPRNELVAGDEAKVMVW